MDTLLNFLPSAARGAALDQRVRLHLADSISSLADAFSDVAPDVCQEVRHLASALRTHPVSSRVMATYVDAVEALSSDDDKIAQSAFEALAAQDLQNPASQRVLTLVDADLGPGMPAVYERLVNDGQNNKPTFSAIPPNELASVRARINSGLQLLDRAFPDLAAEVRALTPEIIVVRPHTTADSEFHGASSFHLWGSILLNPVAHSSRVKIAEVIAHESGHAVLHGLTLGAPLVANPSDERYPSPLRYDPRPMEGVAHAPYVLARMHYTMARLLNSGELTSDEAAEAAETMADTARFYAEGCEIVKQHAQFHPIGARAFEGAAQYMAAHAR